MVACRSYRRINMPMCIAKSILSKQQASWHFVFFRTSTPSSPKMPANPGFDAWLSRWTQPFGYMSDCTLILSLCANGFLVGESVT